MKARKRKVEQTLNHVAEIKLSYSNKVRPGLLPIITNSTDAFRIFYENWDKDSIGFYESFKVMLLNRANKVLGIVPISTGSINGTVVDPRLIFSSALLAAASGIILVHNHPSDNLKPSKSDIDLTKKLKNAGELLDTNVLDHIILSEDDKNYYSFADEGRL